MLTISDLAMVITIEINNFKNKNNKLRTNRNGLIKIISLLTIIPEC